MQPQHDKSTMKKRAYRNSLSVVTPILLLLLGILLSACGGGTQTAAVSSTPTAVPTIQMQDPNPTPIPTLPPYTCGAWTTTPSLDSNKVSQVGIYAKFTKLVNGNPQGVAGATATATLQWPDSGPDVRTVATTADGLAVFIFPVSHHPGALNKIILVTVDFNNGQCKVAEDRAAFFSLIPGGANPNPTPTK